MLQDGGARRRRPADGLIKETTTQTFVKDVIEELKRQPVLIDFWAPWCGPCKQLTPILEKVVRAAKGKVKLVKMNIDEHPAIPGQMGIQSIPAVIAFVNGQPADGFMGALPESQVTAFIERLTKDKLGGAAQDLLEAGRGRARRRAIRPARPRSTPSCWPRSPATWPRSPGSRAAISRPARSTRPSRRSRWCRKPSATMRRSRRCAAPIELAEQAAALGPITELEQKVAANPLDHQARFDLALALNSKGQRDRGARPADRDRAARPQVERRRRPQAARAVVRGVGADRRGDGRGAQAACRRSCSRRRMLGEVVRRKKATMAHVPQAARLHGARVR